MGSPTTHKEYWNTNIHCKFVLETFDSRSDAYDAECVLLSLSRGDITCLNCDKTGRKKKIRVAKETETIRLMKYLKRNPTHRWIGNNILAPGEKMSDKEPGLRFERIRNVAYV